MSASPPNTPVRTVSPACPVGTPQISVSSSINSVLHSSTSGVLLPVSAAHATSANLSSLPPHMIHRRATSLDHRRAMPPPPSQPPPAPPPSIQTKRLSGTHQPLSPQNATTNNPLSVSHAAPEAQFMKWSEVVMLYSVMELFIPPSYPFDFAKQTSADTLPRSRQYVIQGELLKFYLIIRRPTNKEGLVPFGQTEFFKSLRTDVVFLEQAMDERSSMSAPLSQSVLESQTYHRALQPPGAKDVNDKDVESELFFTLPSGDMVLPIEVPIAVEDKFMNKRLVLSVAVTPSVYNAPPSDDKLADILKQGSTLEQNAVQPRHVQQAVRVIMPLKATSRRVVLGTRNYLSICIENAHPCLPITIVDVHMHFFEDKGTSPSKINIDKTCLPLSIDPTDKYEFVVRVDTIPTGEAATESDRTERPVSVVKAYPLWGLIVWGMSCIQGLISSRHDVRVTAPTFNDLMLTITVPTPVLVNRDTFIELNISNMTNYPRDLTFVFHNQDVQADGTKSEDVIPFLIAHQQTITIGRLPKRERATVRVPCHPIKAGIHRLIPIDIVDQAVSPTIIYRIREPCLVMVLDSDLVAEETSPAPAPISVHVDLSSTQSTAAVGVPKRTPSPSPAPGYRNRTLSAEGASILGRNNES